MMNLIHGSSSTRSDQGSPRCQRGPLDFACKIPYSGFQAMSLPAWDNTYDDDVLMNTYIMMSVYVQQNCPSAKGTKQAINILSKVVSSRRSSLGQGLIIMMCTVHLCWQAVFGFGFSASLSNWWSGIPFARTILNPELLSSLE